jgi:hypothetical protein
MESFFNKKLKRNHSFARSPLSGALRRVGHF